MLLTILLAIVIVYSGNRGSLKLYNNDCVEMVSKASSRIKLSAAIN